MQDNEMHVTHVYIEDGTLGYRVVAVVGVSWCASAAGALWLASPPYHSRPCRYKEWIFVSWSVINNNQYILSTKYCENIKYMLQLTGSHFTLKKRSIHYDSH